MHKLTSKRQVTIPRKICDRLNLNPGDYVEFFERDGVIHLVKMEDRRLAGAFQHLTDKPLPDVATTKQAIKQRAASKFDRRS